MKFALHPKSELVFFVLLLLSLVLTAGGYIEAGDGETMFRVTQNLLKGRGIAVSREEIIFPQQPAPFLPKRDEIILTTSAVPGVSGRTYSKYGLGQSLAAVPLFIIGDFFEGFLRQGDAIPDGWSIRLWVSMLNPIALAGCGWVIVVFSRELGYKPTTARWLALAAIFSTLLWPYVKGFYPQPSVTFLLISAVYFAYRWRVTHQDLCLWLLFVLLGMMILFRLSAAIVLPSLVMYIFFTSPKRKRWRWLLPMAGCLGIAGVLLLSYNFFRFGSFFEFGYHEVAWNYPPLMGLYGLLFSPGKGVLFYSPLLVLSSVGLMLFWRRHQAETLLILFLWLSYLAFYAPYNFWTGGFNWGPRFIMPVIPLAILPLGCILEGDFLRGGRHLFFGLFLLGVLVQLPAILVDHSRYLFTAFDSGDINAVYSETIINFDQSPIVRQWPTAIQLIKAYTRSETWELARTGIDSLLETAPNVQNGEALLVSDFLRRNTLNLWWLNDPRY